MIEKLSEKMYPYNSYISCTQYFQINVMAIIFISAGILAVSALIYMFELHKLFNSTNVMSCA